MKSPSQKKSPHKRQQIPFFETGKLENTNTPFPH